MMYWVPWVADLMENPANPGTVEKLCRQGLVSADGVAAIAKRRVPVEAGTPVLVRCLAAVSGTQSKLDYTSEHPFHRIGSPAEHARPEQHSG